MGENTKIEWARHTFNPWYGCQKVSPACDSCYAEGWAKRSGLVEWGPHAARRRSSPTAWKQPFKWDKAAKTAGERHSVFGPSLGDIFDNQVDPSWRRDYFDVIRATPNLIYLLLTKRPQNIIKMCEAADGLPPNVGLGTTVEDQQRADLNVPALLRAKRSLSPLFAFLSCEPLLGPIDLVDSDGAYAFGTMTVRLPKRKPDIHPPITYDSSLGHAIGSLGGSIAYNNDGIDWVIIGGESGGNARPMNPVWARSLRDQCAVSDVPFFFKQWGEWVSVSEVEGEGPHFSFPDGRTVRRVGKKRTGATLDGVEHKAFPPQLAA